MSIRNYFARFGKGGLRLERRVVGSNGFTFLLAPKRFKTVAIGQNDAIFLVFLNEPLTAGGAFWFHIKALTKGRRNEL
jgi:hypothetical protein